MKADKEKHVCLKLKEAIQNISSTELSNEDWNFTSFLLLLFCVQ